MNPDDAIARLRAKASAVERAQRQAAKEALLTRATTSNCRNHCSTCNVKSVEHVIADLSAKASIVEMLSLTAAELQDQPVTVRSRSISPNCRYRISRRPAFPRHHATSRQSSPRTPLPPPTSLTPSCISMNPPICSPQGKSSKLSKGCKSPNKTRLHIDYVWSSPRQHVLNSPPQRPAQGLSSPRGRGTLRDGKIESHHHHPLCLQGHNSRNPCSCHCVANMFHEHSHTPSSKQKVTFSSSPRYYSVAERGFEDMDLVALSPLAWRQELAPDLVEVSSQDRISPITIPSIIGDAPFNHDDDDSYCHGQSYNYHKRDWKKRNIENRRIALTR